MKLIMDAPPKNSRGEQIPVIVGDFVSVNFIGANEVCAISFKIVEKKLEGGTPLTLTPAGKAEEHSRRQYFRLSAHEDMQKGVMSEGGCERITVVVSEAGAPEKQFKTSLIDISGGGMMCAFYDAMPHLNSIFLLTIELPGTARFEARGKLSRIERRQYHDEMVFMVGISFLEINESGREAIINFIFNEHNRQKSETKLDVRG